MASIVRGQQDPAVTKLQQVLQEYESANPGATVTLYRQNSGSIRVRILDERFSGLSKGQRHDQAWKFIADRIGDEDIQEISVLLLLTPGEQRSSLMNLEFDDPVRSSIK